MVKLGLNSAILVCALSFPNIAIACLFGCDSINRDKSTDLAKLREQLGITNLTESDDDVEHYCLKTKKNTGLTVVRLENIDKRNEKAIVVSITAYGPPDIGESELNQAAVLPLLRTRTMNTLNFGISGIVKKVSGDKRCKASSLDKDSREATFAVACDYQEDADLPISFERLKSLSEQTVSYSSCK